MQFFYHIACMGNWREVVDEQCADLNRFGIREVSSCVGGDGDPVEIAARHGVVIHELGRCAIDDYEYPTLRAAHAYALRNPRDTLAYFHTKGVSKSSQPARQDWRRFMMEKVVGLWRENERDLEDFDTIGAAWHDYKSSVAGLLPHWHGNFWSASCAYLASLPPIDEYRRRCRAEAIVGMTPWARLASEMWIGSGANVRYLDRCPAAQSLDLSESDVAASLLSTPNERDVACPTSRPL